MGSKAYFDRQPYSKNPPWGCELSYKNDGGAHRKFLKELLKGTRISISGRGPN